MKWLGRISAADLLTATNGFLGVLAITYILDGRHVIATLLIFLAVLVDGLDGMAARRFGSPHEFGRFLDSISDTVSFCLAPALMIYNNFYDKELGSAWTEMPNAIAVIACLIYATFGIFRLARFAGKDYAKKHFVGLPTPAAAVIIIIVCMLWGKAELNPFVIEESSLLAIVFTIVISVLMISDVPYPNVRGFLIPLTVGVIAMAIFPLIWFLYLSDFFGLPGQGMLILAFVFMILYLVTGPFIVRYINVKKK